MNAHKDVVDIGIIGAGPAGLSMAKFLEDKPGIRVTLFEQASRVGGRCRSEAHGDHIVEYGTCYAIRAHHHVLRWMKDMNIETRVITKQAMDGTEIMDFVKKGSGPSMYWQLLKYLYLRSGLLKRIKQHDPDALDQAALPIAEWLRARNLGKMEHLMNRVVTTLGYGYLSDVSTLQAMRWVDIYVFLTGWLKEMRLPLIGWEGFWARLAESFDVRLNTEIRAVQRTESGVTLIDQHDQSHTFDLLINTLPMHLFTQMSEPTEDEAYVASAMKWGRYAMTLIVCDEWFTHDETQSWIETSHADSRSGRVLVARREVYSSDMKGMLYAIGQRAGNYSPKELEEVLISDVAKFGAQKPRIVTQQLWPYFPQYDREAIREGLPFRMDEMQGATCTFHTGAAFSHEAVSNISIFNQQLLPKILEAAQKTA